MASYSNSIVYRILANTLQDNLHGLILSECFSNDRDEIVFHFEGKKDLQLKVRFADGEMFYFLSDIDTFPGKSAINQFREIVNFELLRVHFLENERVFLLEFANHYKLYFKGFGKFGNILLYAPDTHLPEQIFRRNIKNDEDLDVSSFKPNHLPSIDAAIPDEKALKKLFPWFTPEILQQVKSSDFYSLQQSEQNEPLKKMLIYLQYPFFGMDESKDPPSLCILSKHNGAKGFEALQDYASAYLKRFYFLKQKEQKLQYSRARLKHFQKLVHDNTRRLEEIETRRSYKELGDIILTYAHSIKPGVANAFLPDYYTGNPIRIKLNPDLSAAQNAEKYYGKAKNEALEKQKIIANIGLSQNEVLRYNKVINSLETANDFKALKSTGAEVSAKEKKEEPLPYRQVEFKGYTIWIGKNAKGNDAMLKLASKNDLWLHARGFAGSHVIIRKKGSVFPDEVIAYAARMAAENSKGKNQPLVPVAYTERKFVSKGKGAAPGEVNILKESTIDAVLSS